MKGRTHTKEEHCPQLSHFLSQASAPQGSYKTQHWLQIEGKKKDPTSTSNEMVNTFRLEIGIIALETSLLKEIHTEVYTGK